MKKAAFFLSLVIFCLLSSCSNQGDSPKSGLQADSAQENLAWDSICDPTGLSNILVTQEFEKKTRDLFNAIYKPKFDANHVLNDSIWVSSCIIKTYADYLKANPNLTGMRIVYGAEEIASKKFIARPYLVPTENGNVGSATVINEKWDMPIINTSCSDLQNFYPTFKIINPRMINFEKEFRMNPVPGTGTAQLDSLSKKIWFSRCVFILLDGLLSEHPELDGINIKTIAYDGKLPNRPIKGQGYHNQTSIVLVTTKNKLDNWDNQAKFINNAKGFYRSGYNHGALCPQICN